MSKVETGCRLVLTINNVAVGYANNVSFNYVHDVTNVEVIDKVEVEEFAETRVMVNFTCSYFRVNEQACISNGWMPTVENLLRQPELIAVIKSKVTGRVIAIAAGLKCISRSFNAGAREASVETLTFVGKKLYDEASF